MREIEGLDAFLGKLKYMSKSGVKQVAHYMIGAGITTMRDEIRDGCPAGIKDEVGARHERPKGTVYRGKAGLGVGGAEDRVERPHGRFVTRGTRYIEGQGFVRDSISGGMAPTAAAMVQAGEKKLQQIIDR